MLASAQVPPTTQNPRAATPHPSQVRLEKPGNGPAFRALPAGEIRTTGQLRIIFASGSATIFAAEHGILLHDPASWQNGERIVIVTERRGFSGRWGLTAMRQATAEAEDRVQCILGGFDLDQTGAVLADSFYDIAADQAAIEATDKFARLVDLLVHNKQLGHTTDLDDLKAAGLADAATLQRYNEAVQEADRRTADRDIAESPVDYEREHRLARLANLLIGHFEKDGEGWDVARRAGFPSRELGELWPEATQKVGEMLCSDKAGAH